MSNPSERLKSLGIELPPSPKPAGSYAPVAREGSVAWVSGQIAVEAGHVLGLGRVDHDVTAEVARDLARRATLQALSALAADLGSIDRIRRIVRVTVYVASVPEFVRQHEVANGATDLLIEIFGEEGRSSRVSIGVASLPLNSAVEVELTAIVE